MGDNQEYRDEALSALMDGETDELELRRTLKSLAEDPGQRRKWQRYQLASAAMRRELPPQMVDLSSRISESLAREQPHRPSINRFLRGSHYIHGSAPQVSNRSVYVVGPTDAELPSKTEIEGYLNRMMQWHTENAAATKSQGMMPYARLPQEVVEP